MAVRKSILILLLSIAAVAVYAQSPYTSELGRFQVDQKKGCAPFKVTITNFNLITTDECTSNKVCNVTFSEGTPEVANGVTFTYTTPGKYKLTVLYASILPASDYIEITVTENTVPAFEMYSCGGNKISLKVVDNKYEQYLIDFENDGTPESNPPFSNNIVAQHSYPSAGTYNINVRGINSKSADNCTANIQPFKAIPALPAPTITTLTALDAGTLKLNFSKQTDIQQRMEIAVNSAGPFQLYQPSIYEKDTLRATNLKVDDNYYCFRLSAYDPCANTNTYSNIVCSQNVDLTIESGVNKLAWATANTGIGSMTIQSNGQAKTTILGAPLFYNDVDIECKKTYCYRVIANYGVANSISLEKCGTAFTTASPPSIDNISAVVTDPGVDLNWLVDPKVVKPVYTIFRSSASSGYTQFATATDKKFTDQEYTTSGTYCYRIDYADGCGNLSAPGVPVCPVRLYGTLDDINVVTVTWSAFNGWKSGVKFYALERYNEDGKLINQVNVGLDTSYVEEPDPKNQTIRYRIRAVSNTGGLTASISNNVEIAKKTNLFLPTAFTPNHDKLNDTFTISGQYIKKLSLKIFDRWGVLIYGSENTEAWNGNREGSGQPMPEGTYVWKAQITDTSGKNFSEEGTVLLIRKGN